MNPKLEIRHILLNIHSESLFRFDSNYCLKQNCGMDVDSICDISHKIEINKESTLEFSTILLNLEYINIFKFINSILISISSNDFDKYQRKKRIN